MIKAYLENNKIAGFYDTALGYSNIPEPNVEITREQHTEFLNKMNSENKDVMYQNGEWSFVDRPEPEDTRTREEKIVDEIRTKYSINDELAILRQRDTKPDEFEEYNVFVESVKEKY